MHASPAHEARFKALEMINARGIPAHMFTDRLADVGSAAAGENETVVVEVATSHRANTASVKYIIVGSKLRASCFHPRMDGSFNVKAIANRIIAVWRDRRDGAVQAAAFSAREEAAVAVVRQVADRLGVGSICDGVVYNDTGSGISVEPARGVAEVGMVRVNLSGLHTPDEAVAIHGLLASLRRHRLDR